MPDKAWKKFERTCGDLIAGKRYPANQGGFIDVEGRHVVGQCKEVKTLSLSALTKLAEQIAAEGAKRHKIGVVFAKFRCGSGGGRKARTLVVMTDDNWAVLYGIVQKFLGTTRVQAEEIPTNDLRVERTALPGPEVGGQGLDDPGAAQDGQLSAA